MANQIEAATSKVVKDGFDSLNRDNSETYERLDLQIRGLEAMAREAFQAQFRRAYRAVVKKLEDGEELAPADKDLLAGLVVADAKSYVKYEKEYEAWKDDLQRLLADLKAIQEAGAGSTEDLLHIQAICRDLRAVLPDLTFYLRERERIQSYEQTDIQALTPQVKQLLADIVTAMMKSDKM